MDFIVWQEKYSVNNRLLDSQHKRIFGILNELYEAVKDRRSAKSIQKIIDDFAAAIVSHFDTEEELMKNNNYSYFNEQKIEHETLKKKIIHMQNVYIFGDVPLTPEVFTFLRTWLIEHIEGQDKKYAGLLN
jgi:hemerythrin-like metal-binding protein